MSLLAVLCLLGLSRVCAAQAGSIDTTFDLDDTGLHGVDTLLPPVTISTISVQSDGRVLVGGQYTSVRGVSRNGIVRLRPDGSIDPSFDPGSALFDGVFLGRANALATQPDGKILIAGATVTYGGVPRRDIVRVDTNGSLDLSFDSLAGLNTNGAIIALALQPDGRIVICGDFTSYNGVARSNIARVQADGSLDTSFDVGTGTNSFATSLALQSDGKILLGGNFTSYNGTARNRIARLNTDGSLDTSFTPGTGANNAVEALAVQPDGKILIGGVFTSYGGTARNRIARTNSDGSLDTSLNPGTGSNGPVYALALQADGKTLIGGDFSTYDGTARGRVARIHANGSLDTTFSPSAGANSFVTAVAAQADGKVLIGGAFTQFNSAARNHLVRSNPDGSTDSTFDGPTGPDQFVGKFLPMAAGKVVMIGAFTSYNGTARNRIARIQADGSLDTTFDPGLGANGLIIEAAALQPDGKVLIGGDFTTYDGITRNHLARTNSNGTLDASFNPGTGASSFVYALDRQADGKAVIGGVFTSYDGTPRARVARVNVDGSLDTSFDPGLGPNTMVRDLLIQPDGKVLIGGSFTSYGVTPRNHVARIQVDGSLDTSFDPGTGTNTAYASLALQSDGKILIGGSFTSYNGTTRNGVARLNVDGSLDTSFNPGTGVSAGGSVARLAVQPDGKIVIGGLFTSFNGTARSNIARLNSNGSLDTSFVPGTGTNNTVTALSFLPEGKLLIGGYFTTYNGATRTRVARLFGYEPFTAFCLGDGTVSPCPCGNIGSPGHGCANSTFGAGAWLRGAGSPSVSGDTVVLTATSLTGSTCIFFQSTAEQPAVMVDDGLSCVAGTVVRLGSKGVASNTSSFPQAGDPLISVRGAIPSPGATRYYQGWYRNASASFCTPATSNRTNGVSIYWVP